MGGNSNWLTKLFIRYKSKRYFRCFLITVIAWTTMYKNDFNRSYFWCIFSIFIFIKISFFALPNSRIVSGDNNSGLQLLFYFKNNPVFSFTWVNFYGRIFSQSFVFFDDKFKVILNVWNWIWSIRQLKFIIPSWSRYFKFIVDQSIQYFCYFDFLFRLIVSVNW